MGFFDRLRMTGWGEKGWGVLKKLPPPLLKEGDRGGGFLREVKGDGVESGFWPSPE